MPAAQLTVIFKDLYPELPQVLLAFTDNVPPVLPHLMLMVFPVALPITVAPAGIVQVYEVAPVTNGVV